jgi:acyl carrier protein
MMNPLTALGAPGELFAIVVGLIHTVSAKARQAEITPQSLLLEELALDSLDLVRVVMLIEDRYQVSIDLDEIPKMKRVSDLMSIMSRELRSAA